MNVDGLRELDEMAAKLEATIHKLPQVKRDELLRDVERIPRAANGLTFSVCRGTAGPARGAGAEGKREMSDNDQPAACS